MLQLLEELHALCKIGIFLSFQHPIRQIWQKQNTQNLLKWKIYQEHYQRVSFQVHSFIVFLKIKLLIWYFLTENDFCKFEGIFNVL